MTIICCSKKCRVCKAEYPATGEHFYRRSNGKLESLCKSCVRSRSKKYAANNRKAISERCRAYSAEWGRTHRDIKNARLRAWRSANIERTRKNAREYVHARRMRDPVIRINYNLRTRFCKAVSRTSKCSSVVTLLGCSTADFKVYLESLFLSGMSWDNYGPKGWHIDHIRPCASFNLMEPEEQRVCFHYTNMQPLWAVDNQRKSNKHNQPIGARHEDRRQNTSDV